MDPVRPQPPPPPLAERDLTRGLKALADPTRLRIVGLLAGRARYGEELAEILQLSPATVSHHLRRLDDVQMVRAWRQSPYVLYSLETARVEAVAECLAQTGELLPPILDLPDDDEIESRVLQDVLEEGRLTRLPSRRHGRAVALRWAAHHFETGRIYSERELHHGLLRMTDVVLELRGALLREGWIRQEGGAYRRLAAPEGSS